MIGRRRERGTRERASESEGRDRDGLRWARCPGRRFSNPKLSGARSDCCDDHRCRTAQPSTLYPPPPAAHAPSCSSAHPKPAPRTSNPFSKQMQTSCVTSDGSGLVRLTAAERGPNHLLKFVEFVESRNPLQNLCFPSHGI